METTGRTLEEAKEAALDELGVDDIDAEFEIIEEPKAGLFGRVRKEARVRARIKPTKPRVKTDRRNRKRTKPKTNSAESSEGQDSDAGPDSEATPVLPDADAAQKSSDRAQKTKKNGPRQSTRTIENGKADNSTGDTVNTTLGVTAEGQAEIVHEFMVGLLDAAGLEGDVRHARVEEGIYEVEVLGDDLGILIGPKGQTLQAIQDLGRTVVQRRVQGGIDGRVYMDIGGYRKKRREALERFTIGIAEDVRASGSAKALEPMNPADRKVVHDTVNGIDGVTTRSQGEDANRHVVIAPAD